MYWPLTGGYRPIDATIGAAIPIIGRPEYRLACIQWDTIGS